jgi:hypothetical protein
MNPSWELKREIKDRNKGKEYGMIVKNPDQRSGLLLKKKLDYIEGTCPHNGQCEDWHWLRPFIPVHSLCAIARGILRAIARSIIWLFHVSKVSLQFNTPYIFIRIPFRYEPHSIQARKKRINDFRVKMGAG